MLQLLHWLAAMVLSSARAALRRVSREGPALAELRRENAALRRIVADLRQRLGEVEGATLDVDMDAEIVPGLFPHQRKMLATFVASPGRIWDHDALAVAAWGPQEGNIIEHVRQAVLHIRKALKEHPGVGEIETVWGRGYRWRPGEAA